MVLLNYNYTSLFWFYKKQQNFLIKFHEKSCTNCAQNRARHEPGSVRQTDTKCKVYPNYFCCSENKNNFETSSFPDRYHYILIPPYII